MEVTVVFAWVLILVGIVYGAVLGLGFVSEHWLGGYGSWRRRLLRLGHIACFGMAALNLACAWTLGDQVAESQGVMFAAWLLGIAGVSMPAVCVLSAWRQTLRHAFVLPVLSAAAGCVVVIGVLA